MLTSLASALGLEAESLLQALEGREFEKSVLDDEREAQVLGVSGVPAFIADRKAALSGVQPIENLKRLVDYVRERSVPMGTR